MQPMAAEVTARSRFVICNEMMIEAASTMAMNISDAHVGMWYHSAISILMPTNAKMTARPCCR